MLAFSAAAALALSLPTSTPRASVNFAKYHGIGNDFVLLDCRDAGQPTLSPQEAAAMCDRNFGVGADGVIFVLPPDVSEAQYRMRIYNSDGSEVPCATRALPLASSSEQLHLTARDVRQWHSVHGALHRRSRA